MAHKIDTNLVAVTLCDSWKQILSYWIRMGKVRQLKGERHRGTASYFHF